MIGNLTRIGCIDSEHGATYCPSCCYLVNLGCQEDHAGIFAQLDAGFDGAGAACDGCHEVIVDATREDDENYGS